MQVLDSAKLLITECSSKAQWGSLTQLDPVSSPLWDGSVMFSSQLDPSQRPVIISDQSEELLLFLRGWGWSTVVTLSECENLWHELTSNPEDHLICPRSATSCLYQSLSPPGDSVFMINCMLKHLSLCWLFYSGNWSKIRGLFQRQTSIKLLLWLYFLFPTVNRCKSAFSVYQSICCLIRVCGWNVSETFKVDKCGLYWFSQTSHQSAILSCRHTDGWNLIRELPVTFVVLLVRDLKSCIIIAGSSPLFTLACDGV